MMDYPLIRQIKFKVVKCQIRVCAAVGNGYFLKYSRHTISYHCCEISIRQDVCGEASDIARGSQAEFDSLAERQQHIYTQKSMWHYFVSIPMGCGLSKDQHHFFSSRRSLWMLCSGNIWLTMSSFEHLANWKTTTTEFAAIYISIHQWYGHIYGGSVL